ncbi:3'-5' exonuclease [Belliella pelovolcani]|uniref:DNA polymerase III, epsilon subunit n=1 Tax=Belliella pelovolcani TaxID=529505 RepID=A0A1N7KRJ7_9BACT|nr:3'-5' exonuclease [Belliella pelovolcani]SIS64242.1 DNA polymerase III, epsilon subunit [Belliella pelovolcani]
MMGWLDFLFGKKVAKTTFVEAYEALFAKNIPDQRPISQLNFTVLDTETTGFDVKKDYIVSFGAVKVIGYRLQLNQSKEVYLNTPIQKADSLKVHEILYPIEISPLRDFAEDFLHYVGNDIIVGHHICFDLGMLEKLLKQYGLRNLLNPIIDTQALAMRLEKGPHYDPRMGKRGEYALDALCERYGIALDDRHTAAGDAFLTAQLLMKLLKLAEQKGIRTYGELI